MERRVRELEVKERDKAGTMTEEELEKRMKRIRVRKSGEREKKKEFGV